MIVVSILLLFVLFFVGTELAEIGHQCPMSDSRKERVMHGEYTKIHYNADYFIHLKIQKFTGEYSTCSGALLSSSVVISSGHCVKNAMPSGWFVYGGISDYKDVESGTARMVKEFKVPIAYENFNVSWDLALIYVERFELEAGKIGIVRIPQYELEPALMLNKWHSCQLAGSGRTLNHHGTACETSTRIRYMAGILVGISCCNEALRLGSPEIYPLDTICFRSNSDAPCRGDSGAGIVCKSDLSPEPVLVGIARAKPYCCDSNNHFLNAPIETNIVRLDSVRRNWVNAWLAAYTIQDSQQAGITQRADEELFEYFNLN